MSPKSTQVPTVRDHVARTLANDPILAGGSVSMDFKFGGNTRSISIQNAKRGIAVAAQCLTNAARRIIDGPILSGARKLSMLFSVDGKGEKLTADRATVCFGQLFSTLTATGVSSLADDSTQWVVSADIMSPSHLKEYLEVIAFSNVPLSAKLGNTFVSARPLAPSRGHYANTIRVWCAYSFTESCDVSNEVAIAFDQNNISNFLLPILRGEKKSIYGQPPTKVYSKLAELRITCTRPGEYDVHFQDALTAAWILDIINNHDGKRSIEHLLLAAWPKSNGGQVCRAYKLDTEGRETKIMYPFTVHTNQMVSSIQAQIRGFNFGSSEHNCSQLLSYITDLEGFPDMQIVEFMQERPHGTENYKLPAAFVVSFDTEEDRSLGMMMVNTAILPGNLGLRQSDYDPHRQQKRIRAEKKKAKKKAAKAAHKQRLGAQPSESSSESGSDSGSEDKTPHDTDKEESEDDSEHEGITDAYLANSLTASQRSPTKGRSTSPVNKASYRDKMVAMAAKRTSQLAKDANKNKGASPQSLRDKPRKGMSAPPMFHGAKRNGGPAKANAPKSKAVKSFQAALAGMNAAAKDGAAEAAEGDAVDELDGSPNDDSPHPVPPPKGTGKKGGKAAAEKKTTSKEKGAVVPPLIEHEGAAGVKAFAKALLVQNFPQRPSAETFIGGLINEAHNSSMDRATKRFFSRLSPEGKQSLLTKIFESDELSASAVEAAANTMQA